MELFNKNLVEDYSLLGKPLEVSFFSQSTETVAAELLGKILVKKEKGGFLAARIVETEAYFGSDDPASHAYKGPTPRSSIMFGPAGVAYVYFCYGMHYLFNVVTEKENIPGAVLIRAAEPLAGINIMIARRKTTDVRLLLSGPARLTKAFGINFEYNGLQLMPKNGLFFIDDEYFPVRIVRTRRIGVPKIDGDNFRFLVADSKFVSKEVR
jgi:DNA-3-methyladenine glycosylase